MLWAALETITSSAALAAVAGGLALSTAILVSTHRPWPALAVFLDFLLVAGLLRLSIFSGWDTLTAAAAVIVIRRVVTKGLRQSQTADDPASS